MVGHYNQGVADLENNSNQKKYTINKPTKKGVIIPKALCTLMAIGAVLLAVLVGLVVFFLVPRTCNKDKPPEALTSKALSSSTINEIDERLPLKVAPTHYRISFLPKAENLSFSGTEIITLKALEDTSEIILHVQNISIHSISIRGTNATSNKVGVNDKYFLDGNRCRLVLGGYLMKDQEYNLELGFTGHINDKPQGIYKTIYKNGTSDRVLLSTQFSPTDARRAFPCFDEPHFKAKFTISLARPTNMRSLSNMPLINSQYDEHLGMFWDHFAETPKMPTYLLAFVIGDLAPEQSSHPLIKVWSTHQLPNQVFFAAEVAPKALRYFEDFFKTKFPLEKIDIVGIPEFGFAAMESWGLITFRERTLFYDPETSTNDDKRTTAIALSHEIAHQWFGNLVTPKSWDDLWLKEGFATYLQYFGVNSAEPSWKIMQEFLPSEILRAMKTDALPSARPLSSNLKSSRQIRQTFDEISYAKGACIIRMMHHFLGDQVFQNGLIKYLTEYQNGNADKDQLFEALTKEAHAAKALLQNETIKMIMDTWTDRPGFPVVNVVADYQKNKLRIFQRRFYLNGKEEESSWWIPISFTTNYQPANFNDTTPKFWLKGESEIEIEVQLGQWYLLNIDYTGYYIVNYDETTWRKLTEVIMTFPPLIRAQLISDSMDLARAGLLTYDIPLKMIAKMAVNDKDIMLIPTIIMFDKLQFLNDMLSSTPAFQFFQMYHNIIFQVIYNRVALDDSVDDYFTHRIRSTVLEWSCREADSQCSHEARRKFRLWMIENVRVEPNLRKIVYCTAVREGTEKEWFHIDYQLSTAQSMFELNALRDAMGCTKLKWLLASYLNKFLGDGLSIQDANTVFESVAKNEYGTSLAFDFLRKNWNEIIIRYGDGINVIAKMVQSLASRMNTEFQLSEFQRFKETLKHNVTTTSMALDSAIETIKANVYWMETNYKQVDHWLYMQKGHYTKF